MMLFEDGRGHLGIVEGRHQRVLHGERRDPLALGDRAGALRVPHLGPRRLHRDQHRVVAAVVGPFELHHLVPAGEGAGQADPVHGGLGARVGEAHLLQAEALADQLRRPELAVVGHPVERSLGGRLPEGLHHHRMGVAHHERPEAHGEVHVLATVHVPHARAFGPLDVDGIGLVGAEVAGHSEGQHPLGPLVHLEAGAVLPAIPFQLFGVRRHARGAGR